MVDSTLESAVSADDEVSPGDGDRDTDDGNGQHDSPEQGGEDVLLLVV